MSDLVLLSAELPLTDGQSGKRDPSFRVMNVPRHMADNIKKWYEISGWKAEIKEMA